MKKCSEKLKTGGSSKNVVKSKRVYRKHAIIKEDRYKNILK